jgi:hypothetical protein
MLATARTSSRWRSNSLWCESRLPNERCSPPERLFNWIQRWSAGADIYAGGRSFFASLLISRRPGERSFSIGRHNEYSGVLRRSCRSARIDGCRGCI